MQLDQEPLHLIGFVFVGILILAAGVAIERSFGALDAKESRRHRALKEQAREAVSRSVKIVAGYEMPVGKYALWPWVAFWVLLIAGAIGSLGGSGGSLAGFAVAVVLNPILWGCIYFWSWTGSMRCPHCRATVQGEHLRRMPVGSEIECDNCGNAFVKPRS